MQACRHLYRLPLQQLTTMLSLHRLYLKLHEGQDGKAALHANAAAGILLAKKSRFPGLPTVALAQGRGMLAVSDVTVTWVVTDVVGSTQLWEWNAAVMNQAIEQHNQVRGWANGLPS
jgi:hypothetical protein